MNSRNPRASFVSSAPEAIGQTTASGRRQPELLGDLECDRLRALGVVGTQVHVHERPGQLEGELDGQPAAIVVAAEDLVDRRPVRGRRKQLLPFEPGRAEHRGVESLDRRAGRHGACEVPGRGAGQRPKPELLRLRARDCDDTVLEGVCRVRGVQLEIELAQAEHLGEAGCLDERSQAGREVRLGRRLDRQERAVAPQRRRAGRDPLSGQPWANLVEVVLGLERTPALRAGADSVEADLVAAAAAAEADGGHVISPSSRRSTSIRAGARPVGTLRGGRLPRRRRAGSLDLS